MLVRRMIKFIFLVVLSFSSTAVGEKKCSPVLCPDYKPDLDVVFSSMGKLFDIKELPSNGICLDGKVKYVVDGKYFGRPGETKCTCIRAGGDNVGFIAEPQECCGGEVQCPVSVPYYKEETVREFYLRMGATYKKKGILEGCCPKDYKKFYVNPKITGVKEKYCYCDPPSDKRVYFEGKPKIHSETSSEFEE